MHIKKWKGSRENEGRSLISLPLFSRAQEKFYCCDSVQHMDRHMADSTLMMVFKLTKLIEQTQVQY
jgi:hypothetical protein